MSEKIKIGTWQGPVWDNDFQRNIDKVRAVLKGTKDKELDFICFPECYLSGGSERAARESAVDLNHPEILQFIEESKEYDTVILVGMSEKKGERLYNSQLVVYQGRLLGAAHKTVLVNTEAKYFSSDLELPVFQAKGIKFGVVICHSTSFVEPALYLRWKGARLLFTPHFNNIAPEGTMDSTYGKRIPFWDHRTMVLNNQAALATLLKMVVVRSNVVIVSEDALGAGDSNIWDMNGAVVAQGTPFTECVVSADFDRSIFLEEHWINRNEVPVKLCEMIADAAKEYNESGCGKCADRDCI